MAGCQSLGMCLVWEHAGLGWSNYRFKGWDDPVLCLAVGMGSSLVPCLFGNNGRWDKTSAMWASHGGLCYFFSPPSHGHTRLHFRCVPAPPLALAVPLCCSPLVLPLPHPTRVGPPLCLGPGTALPACTPASLRLLLARRCSTWALGHRPTCASPLVTFSLPCLMGKTR